MHPFLNEPIATDDQVGHRDETFKFFRISEEDGVVQVEHQSGRRLSKSLLEGRCGIVKEFSINYDHIITPDSGQPPVCVTGEMLELLTRPESQPWKVVVFCGKTC